METDTRTPVVLYACTTTYGDPDAVLEPLRAYADRQGWRVVAAFGDKTGIAAEKWRPQFLRAKALIEGGQARILVTQYESMAEGLPSERVRLHTWLAAHGAELHCTGGMAPQRATGNCSRCGWETVSGTVHHVDGASGPGGHVLLCREVELCVSRSLSSQPARTTRG